MNKYILIVSICLFTLFSCDEEITDVHQKNYTLELSKDTLIFNVGGGMKSVEILTNQDSWDATYEENKWFTAKEFRDADGYEIITIEADSTTSLEKLESEVIINAGPYETKLHVIQIGNEPTIYLGRDSVSVDKDTIVVNLPCISNIDFNITNSADWVTVERQQDEETIRLLISRNETGAGRKTTLLFKQTDGDYMTSLVVVQSADYNPYEPIDIDKVKGNKQIPIVSGWSTSTLAQFNIENAFDGDKSTYFQSDYQEYPNRIEFSFKVDAGNNSINSLIHYPSQESGQNTIYYAQLYVKNVGVSDFSFKALVQFDRYYPSAHIFDTPLTNVDEIKFVVVSTHATSSEGGIPSVSCAEIEFYSASGRYEEVFTDNTYSELQPGISMDNILKIDDNFYQNLAKHLYNGTYEYNRILDLSAINPDRYKAKISHASMFEHTTGIYFNAEEESLVFCGAHTGSSPSLIIFNNNSIEEYPLTEGVNKITTEGKVYINNPSDVKVHIASGIYNGVYNSIDMLPEEGDVNNESEVLDIVSDKIHLIAPYSYINKVKSSLKNFETNINTLAEAAQIFYGVNEGAYSVKSRLGICIGFGDVKNESIINFNNEEFEAICNFTGEEYSETNFRILEKLGAAYEPFVDKLWGIPEVTPKLFALNYYYKTINLSLVSNSDYYSLAFEKIMVNGKNYSDVNDKWAQIVPLWQLLHYLEEVKGLDNYYAELANAIKQSPTIGNYYISDFMSLTNKVSNIDFSSFYSKWNMGSTTIKPTEQAAGGFPYYVEANKDAYEDLSDPSFMMFFPNMGGFPTLYFPKNITALEVFENGVLRHIETYKSFTPPMMFQVKWSGFKSHMKIVAIGTNGNRITVN